MAIEVRSRPGNAVLGVLGVVYLISALAVLAYDLVQTWGAAGMTLLRPGMEPVHTHARARAVFDVTGAGDTVVSTLALALASGIDITVAIDIASVAAGLVISKVGTATVDVAELRAAIEEQSTQ